MARMNGGYFVPPEILQNLPGPGDNIPEPGVFARSTEIMRGWEATGGYGLRGAGPGLNIPPVPGIRPPPNYPVPIVSTAPVPYMPIPPGAQTQVPPTQPPPGPGDNIPAWLAAILAGAGLPSTWAGLGAFAVAGLGAARIKMPWQTEEGEGVIAPWTQMEEIDNTGIWRQEGAPRQLGPGMMGDQIVSSWNTNPAAPQFGHTFYRLASGKLATMTNRGMWKTWRPYRSIVIGKKLTSSNVRRVSSRIKSHVKSLRKVLSVLK